MVFGIVVLVFSAILHEVAHGVMAQALGDPTARLEGRLTLNPIKHIDPMGSIFLPLILVISNAPLLFGWAKPVPYNPFNLKKGGRWAEALVAGAGPLTNLVLAITFGFVVQALVALGAPSGTTALAFSIVVINVMLTLFNLIPIPPLDGSKVLASLLPKFLAIQYDRLRQVLEFNPLAGFGLVILFVVVFGNYFTGTVIQIAQFLAGA